MALFRKIPFLTCEVTPRQKVKINLSGCNFSCKGCFAIARKECGREFTVEGLLRLLVKSCTKIYGHMVDDVQMTGGEPLTDPKYLFALIEGLKTLGVSKIGISTNGYNLTEDVVKKLKALNISYIKLDLKAYSEDVHRWYTGKSNERVLRAVKLLHEHGLNFYVRTIVIPNVVDASEVEEIAKFLSSIDPDIPYRLYQFSPELLEYKLSRRPAAKEMLEAYEVARRYLKNVELFIYKPEHSGIPKLYRTPYDPNYKVVEIRADELLETFMKIDRLAKLTDPGWNVQFYTMNQVLEEGG